MEGWEQKLQEKLDDNAAENQAHGTLENYNSNKLGLILIYELMQCCATLLSLNVYLLFGIIRKLTLNYVRKARVHERSALSPLELYSFLRFACCRRACYLRWNSGRWWLPFSEDRRECRDCLSGFPTVRKTGDGDRCCQKSRVVLARALYKAAEVYLLSIFLVKINN